MSDEKSTSPPKPLPRPGEPAASKTRNKLIAASLLVLGGLAVLAAAYYIAGKAPELPTSEPAAVESESLESPESSSAPASSLDEESAHKDGHNKEEASATVSADNLLTAVQSRGWRLSTAPSRIERNVGDVQIVARLNKEQHNVNLTLFQFTDMYPIQDIVEQTKAPGEAIVFGKTVARVVPADSSRVSADGSKKLAKTLREFKSIANHL